MKLRATLIGTIALVALGSAALGLGLPSSPLLGPFTNVMGALLAPYVASNASVADLHPGLKAVRVGGYAAAGDGGGHVMVYDAVNACGAGGHPAADGVTCINSVYGNGVGSWNIDWASVRSTASMPLFGCFGTGADCTAALQSAINTTLPVYMPAGYYVIQAGVNNPGTAGAVAGVTVTTIGQQIYGDGRMRTTIDCRLAASPGTTNPCITFNTGVEGPELSSLEMIYGLFPDTSNATTLQPYGPLIYAQNQTRARIRQVRLVRTSMVADLRGNAGGFDGSDIEYNCSGICWYVDGSLDSMRWTRTQGWIFLLTANQQTAFYNNATAFDFGRLDDFRISDSLFIGHLAFSLHRNVQTATAGGPLGGISNFDCDTGQCMTMTAGSVTGSNVLMTMGVSGSHAAYVYGGTLDLTNLQMDVGYAVGAAFFVGGDGTYGTPRVTVNGGSTTHLGTLASQFDAVDFQVGRAGQTNGELTIIGHQFVRVAGSSASPACNQNAAIYRYAGRLTAIGNRIADMGTAGTGSCPNKFISHAADDYSRVVGNVGPGWTNTFPSSATYGVYQFNGGTGNALPTTTN